MHRSDARLSAPFIRGLPPLLALLLPLLIVACSTPTGGGGNDPTCGDQITVRGLASSAVGFAGNNDAVLMGSAYGDGSEAESLLRCVVPFEVAGPAQGFVFGDATLVRYSSASNGVDVIVPVRNDGAARCFVRFDGIAYLSGSGTTLTTEDFSYVDGSVARSDNGNVTDTCLDEGESGWLFDYMVESFDLFEQTARVRAATVRANGINPQLVAPSIVPQSYQVAAGGGDLAVTVLNQGSATAEFGNFSKYLRLDANGDPYGWEYFDDPNASQLGVGATTVLSADVTFNGSAAGVHPFIDFEPAGTPVNAPGTALADAAARTGLRDAREAAREVAIPR